MSTPALAAERARDLNRNTAAAITFAEASAHCRRLARSHYENFTVASWLLPRRLRPHFYHLYAYCRTADDLADEAASPAESLRLLDAWEARLDELYAGTASESQAAEHHVFIALGETVREFAIPRQPLADLLIAFRRDQRQTRYETIDELLGYCRYSANPVGRLVLYLGGCHNEERGRLSDSVCTGLQLVNFWQDVARDFERGRIYLPRQVLRAHGLEEHQLAERRATPAFRRALAGEVERAEQFLLAGLPLVGLVPRELSIDIELFIRGGLEMARAIRRLDYDVWSVRPTIGKARQLQLLAGCWWRSQGGWRRSQRGRNPA